MSFQEPLLLESDPASNKNSLSLEKKIKHYKEGGCLNFGFSCCVTAMIIATIFSISVLIGSYHKSTLLTEQYNQILLEYSPDWYSTVTILPDNLETESYLMSERPELIRLPSVLSRIIFSIIPQY